MYSKNTVGIFVCIIAFVAILEALDCDPQMCSNVCGAFGLNGTCKATECDCSYDKKCSMMVDTICDVACDKLHLKGECDDDGYCICKAELEPCAISECYEQCLDDPRALECESAGGVVTPIACVEYGPLRTCGCLCTRPGEDKKTSYAVFEYSVKKHPNDV